MWRYLAGAVAALLLVGAGALLYQGRARQPSLPAAPQGLAQSDDAEGSASADLPEASAKTREQKRFGRYDKDKDGAITRDEYLVSRRKAYARLDINRDGRLSFDEWAIKAVTKFAKADADHSGAMNAGEFATTAVKRKARIAAKCACPPPAAATDD